MDGSERREFWHPGIDGLVVGIAFFGTATSLRRNVAADSARHAAVQVLVLHPRDEASSLLFAAGVVCVAIGLLCLAVALVSDRSRRSLAKRTNSGSATLRPSPIASDGPGKSANR